MATYAISDIHGQLEKFKEMLNLIDFKFDGSDEIHILGDMIDWGEQSLETLLYCKELAKNHCTVHVYMGNHEQMMLENHIGKQNNFIQTGTFEKFISLLSIVTGNWYCSNGGDKTYNSFKELVSSAQADIIEFLKQLPYYNENLEVNGQKFYLAHAAPHTNCLDKMTQMYECQKHEDELNYVVWHRYKESEQSFADERYKNYILIHGHTPTEKKNDEGLCVIQRTRDRICIDTGAKMMCMHEYYPQCRLSCLRLDDLTEFYVG